MKSQFHFLKEATSRSIENQQHATIVQQTYTASLCSYINNIFPQITKLEDTIHKLNHKLTTEQDTIQINALDFDPDIIGPNIPRAHNNTMVVSVQELLTSPKPELAAATKKKLLTGTNSTPHTTIQRNPMGMTISPSTFQTIHQYIIPWNNTRSP